MTEEEACTFEKLFFGAVTVGERGQVVIPSEARRELGIDTGEKLLVFAHPGRSGVVLVKVAAFEKFLESLRETLAQAEQAAKSGEEEVRKPS
ncbi:MAG: AbrB/MazE/SpoVT family DNA-binding domain-containing protein [Armatimonadota bacterium]